MPGHPPASGTLMQSTVELSAPFLGLAPCDGDTELEALPEELMAMEALMRAQHQFSDLMALLDDNIAMPYQSAFLDALSQARLGIGTIRFLQSLHLHYQNFLDTPVLPGPNAPDAGSMVSWITQVEERSAFRRYPEAIQTILQHCLDSTRQMVVLAATFPNPPAISRFMEGIDQCEAVLNRLHLEALLPPPPPPQAS